MSSSLRLLAYSLLIQWELLPQKEAKSTSPTVGSVSSVCLCCLWGLSMQRSTWHRWGSHLGFRGEMLDQVCSLTRNRRWPQVATSGCLLIHSHVRQGCWLPPLGNGASLCAPLSFLAALSALAWLLILVLHVRAIQGPQDFPVHLTALGTWYILTLFLLFFRLLCACSSAHLTRHGKNSL